MGRLIGNMTDRIWNCWTKFWFDADYSFSMAMFRPALASILFFFYLTRTSDLTLFYTDAGLLSVDVARQVMPMDFRRSLFEFAPRAFVPHVVYAAHGLLLASLAALGLGFYPRVSAILTLVLHLSFIHRNMLVMFGVDMIATYFLFLFCLADARKPALMRPDLMSMAGSMAYRLSQIQVCIIYAYSGLEKMKGQSWWGGEALWTVLANSQLARMDFSWIAQYPLLIVAATYSTLLWEIYFPVLIWVRPMRLWVIAFGAALHVGIAISINLSLFGLLMIATYLLFIKREDFERVSQVFRRRADKTYV
jgi:hypothetical protein